MTLCIPTVFVSWTGEALDKKTPLLRSERRRQRPGPAAAAAARRHARSARVSSSCGAEQEYFLVDRAFAAPCARSATGGSHACFGGQPAKGQQFDDHYFGAIPERVQVFMQDVERELYRLGVPAEDAPQRSGARPVRDRPDLRGRQRRHRPPAC
jgi:glutamine synthetase